MTDLIQRIKGKLLTVPLNKEADRTVSLSPLVGYVKG